MSEPGSDATSELWRAATEHPFLAAVGDGSITDAAFDRWLVQDVAFVTDLLRFQARLLARAPRAAHAVLAGGCSGIVEELEWFDHRAAERGLDLTAEPLPATREYLALLERLDASDPHTALTALWAVEQVYLDAWTFAGRTSGGPFEQFVQHWTEPPFGAYVAGLRTHADPVEYAAIVDDVLRHEIAFWDATLQG